MTPSEHVWLTHTLAQLVFPMAWVGVVTSYYVTAVGDLQRGSSRPEYKPSCGCPERDGPVRVRSTVCVSVCCYFYDRFGNETGPAGMYMLILEWYRPTSLKT